MPLLLGSQVMVSMKMDWRYVLYYSLRCTTCLLNFSDGISTFAFPCTRHVGDVIWLPICNIGIYIDACLQAGKAAAQSLLGKKTGLLVNPKQMVPSWTEAGARLLVARFLNRYVSVGNLVWVLLPIDRYIAAMSSCGSYLTCLVLRVVCLKKEALCSVSVKQAKIACTNLSCEFMTPCFTGRFSSLFSSPDRN